MISVIIPTLNEEKTIEKCLNALKGQDAEIIVVDGGSEDNTVRIAEKYADRILFDNGNGPGEARNLGARYAKSDIIAFTDADTVVSSNWVRRIENDFKMNIIGLGGIVKPLDGNIFDKIIFTFNSDIWYRFSSLFGFYQFSGNNSAYKKEVFKRIGGFNEKLSFLEDTDLSLRISKLGKVIFDSALVVFSSVRRFRQKGYFRTGVKFAISYIKYFMNIPIKDGYFKEIKKF